MNCKTHEEYYGVRRMIKNPRKETREKRQCKKCRDYEQKCLLVQN
jgi:hypothetical protein